MKPLFFKQLFSVSAFFCYPPTTSPFLSNSYHCVTGAQMSLCEDSWLVAGTACHGSVLPSGGWLITVEVTEHPRHPPSTEQFMQLLNYYSYICHNFQPVTHMLKNNFCLLLTLNNVIPKAK